MDNEKRFYVAVKGLIFCDDKFLIIQRSDKTRGEFHYWEFPGGRMEFGEKPEEALKREVKEETGLEIKPICPLNMWTFFREENVQLVGVNFLCTTDSKKIQLSDEHLDYRWVEEAEVLSYNIHPTIKDEMAKWNWKEIKKTFVL